MTGLLVYVIVVVILLVLALYAVRMITMDAVLKTILQVACVVVAILLIASRAGIM